MINDYRFRVSPRPRAPGNMIRKAVVLALIVAGSTLLLSESRLSAPPATTGEPQNPATAFGPRVTSLPIPAPRKAPPNTEGRPEISNSQNDVPGSAAERAAAIIEAAPLRSPPPVLPDPASTENEGAPLQFPDEELALTENTGRLPSESANIHQPILDEPLLSEPESSYQIPDRPAYRWAEEKVKAGDSLSRIFSRMGLSASLLHEIVGSSKEAKRLVNIKPGEIVRVRTDDEGRFQELVLQRSAIRSLHIVAQNDQFITKTQERHLEKRVAKTSGTITTSLYEGAQRSGLSDELIMELAQIFGWDIDFALEIRAGDHFSLVYEERYLDGEIYDSGPILAAEFVNSGHVFRAIRYEYDDGHGEYFSPDGHSMRKAFLRAPVDFRRISSRFTKARWHPVLGKKRPHKGVDYAAAIGTPIKAAGDGKVIFRGKKGGYGNTVIIKHANKYTTLYAHMSRFKGSVKNGTRVRQGQTIGYVGKSGLATGPHLHYEFRVNGAHRNPLTVKLPTALPIENRYRKDFEKTSVPLLAQLDLMSKTMLAAN